MAHRKPPDPMSAPVSPKRTALLAAARERILVLDGAMGTMIQALQYDEAAFRGARFADFHRDVRGNNDLLILTQPQAIEAIHAAYLRAGADIVVCHLGLTTGGSIGAETALRLEDCPAKVDAWAEAALKVRRDIIVLVHGGPVSSPDNAAFIISNTKNCHGFYGASSMERLPTEAALTEQTRKFKAIGRQRG